MLEDGDLNSLMVFIFVPQFLDGSLISYFSMNCKLAI